MKRVNKRHEDALSRQTWRDFERLLADHYRREGFQVEHCGTSATGSRYDGGIDLKLRRGDEYILVECKHWNVMQVPHNVVHQLMGIMVNEGATGAIVVTSGEFTPYAREAANKLGHVQLVDGVRLREMLGLPESLSRSDDLALSPSGRRGGRPRYHDDSGKKAWLVFSVVAAIALYFLLRALFSATAWTAGHSSQPSETSSVVPMPRPSPSPQELSTIRVGSELGTAKRVPTADEIRESQRQADEAMKVIEATTPELK